MQPVLTIYSVRNTKNFSFGALLNDKDLKCNEYSEFRKKSQSDFTKLILGDDLALPLRLKGVAEGFNSYFDIYGVGKFHFMLMPTKNGINNFASSLADDKVAALQSINRVAQIVEMTHPLEDFYIFESGASEIEKQTNKRGIIPAHLHFVTNNRDESVTIEKIQTIFNNTVEDSTQKFKNVSIENLYENILKLTKNGDLGYKFIAKKLKNGFYDAFLYIKENDDGTPKSQSIPKVLSRIFNKSDNRSFYSWKIVDTDPNNWNSITKEKILQDRKLNREFYNKIKKLGLLM